MSVNASSPPTNQLPVSLAFSSKRSTYLNYSFPDTWSIFLAHNYNRVWRCVEMEMFARLRQIFNSMREEKEKEHSSYAHIPPFYFKVSLAGAAPLCWRVVYGVLCVIPAVLTRAKKSGHMSDLKSKIRKEARTRFLEKKAEALLDEEELEKLWETIVEYQTPPKARGERVSSRQHRCPFSWSSYGVSHTVFLDCGRLTMMPSASSLPSFPPKHSRFFVPLFF